MRCKAPYSAAGYWGAGLWPWAKHELMRSARGGSATVVSHSDNKRQAITAQLLFLWSATTIASQRPPMEASGLEMCIAVGETCHGESDGSVDLRAAASLDQLL